MNVASNCGFTKQYSQVYKNFMKNIKTKGFVIIGVPSNQFGGQEPGTNKEIKNFCETNFNITFPITGKDRTLKVIMHMKFTIWAKINHFGKSTIPKWNFHKILINTRSGKIQKTFQFIC